MIIVNASLYHHSKPTPLQKQFGYFQRFGIFNMYSLLLQYRFGFLIREYTSFKPSLIKLLSWIKRLVIAGKCRSAFPASNALFNSMITVLRGFNGRLLEFKSLAHSA